MRIALLCETFPPDVNGVAHTVRQLLTYLRRTDHQALVLAPRNAPAEYEGFPVKRLLGMPLPFYREVRLTPPQPGMLASLRDFRPDVVHAVGPALLGAAAPSTAARLGVPLVSSYHTHFADFARHYGLGALSRPITSWLRWVHNRTAITLCPSTDTIAKLRDFGFRRLRLWARGVDGLRFHPRRRSEEWRRSVGVAPGETLFAYVGRLAPEKRIERVGEALRSVPGSRLVIVGDGPARAALERRFAGMPVTFTGYLSGDDLAVAYASADAFAFASDTDTFGQVILEAMASGLPVVAAASGGAVDLVKPKISGFLFDPATPEELGAPLRALAADPALRARMGNAGRRLAEKRSWPSVMEEMIGHYRRAAAMHPIWGRVLEVRPGERSRSVMRAQAALPR